MAMMRHAAPALALACGVALTSCSAGEGGSGFKLPVLGFDLGPKADALVMLDYQAALRTTATVPSTARKVRLLVKDRTDKIVGGIVFRDIPGNNTITLDGLPANTELKFDATIGDQVGAELGRGKKKQTLAPQVGNNIPLPIFMNAGEFQAVNTNSNVQTSNSNTVTTRVTFAAGDWFRVKPVMTAVDSSGAPVVCSPTFLMKSGYETLDEQGTNEIHTGLFTVPTLAGTYDVQVEFTPNCPGNATTITRRIEFEKIATLSMAVD